MNSSFLKAKPSKIDMIIFVADKIEWDQEGQPPYLKELEEAYRWR